MEPDLDSLTLMVGGKYENREGIYEVLSIDDDRLVIMYDAGKQLATSLEVQTRILDNMVRERSSGERSRSSNGVTGFRVPRWYGERFEGLKEGDFKGNVTGTHWRSREQLGGAVSARIAAPQYDFESWAIYKRPQVHWADRRHYLVDDGHASVGSRQRHAGRVYQGKYFADVDATSVWYGFYIERTDKPGEPRSDWDNFLEWLGHQDGEKNLMEVAAKHSLDARIAPDWSARQASSRRDGFNGLAAFLRGIPDDQWVNLLIGTEMPKRRALSQGPRIADEIAGVFTTLIPLYEAVAQPFIGNKD